MKIANKDYPTDVEASAFLERYLERVKSYVESNGIGKEYAQDIATRVAEKLEAIGREVTERDAIKIVNDLWEPEEIFADVPRHANKFAEGVESIRGSLKSPLYRDSSKGIVFWVCAGLWEKFEIDPLYIRLLFVFLFFFYGTGIIAYLALALLLKNRSSIVDGGGNEENNTVTKSAVAKVSEVATSVFGRLLSLAASLLLAFLAFWLWVLSIGLLIVSGIAFSDITIANQSLFTGVHHAVPTALILAGISLFVLAWGAAFGIFKKRIAGNGLYTVCAIAIAASLVLGAYGGAKTVGNFAHREKVESIVLEARTGTAVTVALPDDALTRDFPASGWSEIRVVRSSDSVFRISSITEVSAADSEAAKGLVANLVPLTVAGTGSSFEISGKDPEFTKKSPMAFAKRIVVISVPDGTGLKLQNENRGSNVRGVSVTQIQSYMSTRQCPWTLKYIPSEEAFACDPASFSTWALVEAKINYIRNFAYSSILRNESRSNGMRRSVNDDDINVVRLDNGAYRVSYRPENPYSESITEEMVKTYSVDVDSEGRISVKEIAGK